MTKEERQLVLVDICERLLYGVRIKLWYQVQNNNPLVLDEEGKIENLSVASQILHDIETGRIKDFKPYLRSMETMTEEEYIKYRTMQGRNCDYGEATICVSKSLYQGLLYDDNEPLKINVYYPNPVIQDWLNANHFDYRGLIEKGLALEAPEDMYNTKQ